MRRQYRSFVVTVVVVSLCCSFIGCKLNNGGSWYKPNSYTWHNPFKPKTFEEDEYSRFAEENNGIRMPSHNQAPDLDLSPPPAGYSGNQMAQNTARPSNTAVGGSTVGGYPSPGQNSPVAMNNQQVNYQGQPNYPNNVPQGQPVVQNQYYQNQPPQNQSPQYSNVPPAQSTYQNYGSPAGQPPSNQVSNGYAAGHNTYDTPEYNPGGGWR